MSTRTLAKFAAFSLSGLSTQPRTRRFAVAVVMVDVSSSIFDRPVIDDPVWVEMKSPFAKMSA